jgi:hypothetical protein
MSVLSLFLFLLWSRFIVPGRSIELDDGVYIITNAKAGTAIDFSDEYNTTLGVYQKPTPHFFHVSHPASNSHLPARVS